MLRRRYRSTVVASSGKQQDAMSIPAAAHSLKYDELSIDPEANSPAT